MLTHKLPNMKSRFKALHRGMSLVELMVGITIGLFVVAAATTLASTQLVDNRRMQLEVQIQQDLRASMDIITRQLRRAGGLKPIEAQDILAASDGSPGVSDQIARMRSDPGSVEFAFFYKTGESGPNGFKLDSGVIRSLLNRGSSSTVWQDLTDSQTVNVTRFVITPMVVAGPVLPCPKLCPPSNDTACWPTMVRRSYTVELEAQSVRDPSVRRALRNEVQIRNDWVRVNDPALGDVVCPS